MDEAAHIEVLYDALRALPEATVGEIIDGRLYAQPRPSAVHSDVQLGLGGDIEAMFDRGRDGPGGWRILTEPEVHFERDVQVLVPDLAGWRRERMPQLPDDQRIEIGPDWVCEILSPSTASKDRETKMPVYARYGVTHAWIIDPRAKTLEAFALQAGAWTLAAQFSGDDEIWAPPFRDHGIAPPLGLSAGWVSRLSGTPAHVRPRGHRSIAPTRTRKQRTWNLRRRTH